MPAELPTAESVEGWVAGLRAEIDRLDHDLAPILAKREQLRRQLELLERLRESFVAKETMATQESVGTPAPGESIRDYVIARATELLEEEAGPLHINELHARFLNRGFEVPGAGEPVNITSHIRHSDNIVSPKKGIYVLTHYATNADTTQ